MRLRGLLTVMILAGAIAHSSEEPFDPTKVYTPAKPYTNELGMIFVRVPGTEAQFSIYQTRVADFRAFVRETGYVHMRETSDQDRMWSLDWDGSRQRGRSWDDPGFTQGEDHPVVGVNWHDAKAFCEWLTVRERAAGRLPVDREYRLPRDHEWSVAVGLAEEDPAQTPREKDSKINNKYPWGQGLEGEQPPAGAGNYPGREARDGHWPSKFYVIDRYKDDFPRTAPVRQFQQNKYGLYNLGSNVCEWCEDEYQPGKGARVTRGASWHCFIDAPNLLSSNRNDEAPALRKDYIGFRCVIGESAPPR